ncbi:MAG: anaerobic ribonucleoside-triphosphate reductase activating protein [Bacteroidales bacterium]|nr:anaerobic ribonucleoside-triphosphate reductase activating protein [Bacteroidales bacterium]
MLKYSTYDVVFQEIPDEVTLAISLTNCPNHCPGCHSPHLWHNEGKVLDKAALRSLLSQYSGYITCCCLMGGDNDPDAVVEAARTIHQFSKLKVAWYSGRELLPSEPSLFQYIKLGPYCSERGGLKDPHTNQRMYKNVEGTLVDITPTFWRDHMLNEALSRQTKINKKV